MLELIEGRTLRDVRKTEGGQAEQWLFDLAGDIGEKNDLLNTKRSETNRLIRLLEHWEANTQAPTARRKKARWRGPWTGILTGPKGGAASATSRSLKSTTPSGSEPVQVNAAR